MSSTPQSGDSSVILATGGYDNCIRFWSVQNGQAIRIIPQVEPHVNAMEITPDKQHLAVANYQSIKLFDVQVKNTTPVVNFEGGNAWKNVTAVGFHEDGRWMYSAGEDGFARVWDLRAQSGQSQKKFQARVPINCATLHPNQVEIYLADQSGMLYIWDLRSTGNALQILVDNDVSVNHLSIEPEGNCLAAVDNKGHCYTFSLNVKYANAQRGNMIDIEPMQRKLKLRAHKRYALKCKFSPDSTLLATTSGDHTAKIWRTADLLPLSERSENDANGHTPNTNWTLTENLSPLAVLSTTPTQRWVWDVAFSSDSQYVITGSSDCNARLWNVATGEIKRQFTTQKPITAIAFSDTIID